MTIVAKQTEREKPIFQSLLWRYVAVALIIWTVVIGGSLAWNLYLVDAQFSALAHKEAAANFNKDQSFRLWGTKHGGVYVPITTETPPSPYMAHIPERDIETPSGRKLTLLNPAYMLRQVMSDHGELYGVRGHITGLIVLRPGNAPDEWQKQALLQLKAGADEVKGNTDIDGEPFHRLMRPMYMKPGCDKCHGHLGFETGDFRGGVSVSVPLAPYIAAQREGSRNLAVSHGLIWLLGLAGIGFGARQVRGRIEERDQADELLEAHRTRFETLLNLAPDAFIVMDGQYHIVLFSQGAANIFRYQAEEVLGQRVEMLMPEEYRDGHAGHVREFSSGEETTRAMGERRDIMGRRKDGSRFPAEASVARLKLGGEVLYTVTLRDVTQRNERDEALRQAQRMEAVGQLTGGIAHDFNNLLAIILGNLSFIDSELPGDSQLKAMIAPALRAVDRGASLTQRLLAFSRRQTLRVAAVDATDLLYGLSDMLRRSLGEDIRIELKVDGDLWLCDADAGQLEQAILNLANNARDAMPSGGRLVIAASNHTLDEDAAKSIENAHPGDYVSISVSDSGTGIEPEVLERIFEPFFTTKDVGEGTGLGLSMAYGFATQSGGYLKVDSKIGEGTLFQLGLPRNTGAGTNADSKTAKAVNATEEPIDSDSGETILVVEDDPDIRTMVGQMVSRLGYGVLLAGTSDEAFEHLKNSHHIDLLLTDVILADAMNGAELATAARDMVVGLKVVFMSGYAGDALARRIDIGDEASLLSKPFRRDDLARHLRRALDQ